MECYTYLRNIRDLLSDGITPYERRFGEPFNGPSIPFGSLVEYHTKFAKDSQESINLERKSYLDCSSDTHCTRVEFRGDVLAADLEELETMDASEIFTKRLNAKEVMLPKENGNFIFPVANRRIKLSGGDQELRTLTLIREFPIRREDKKIFWDNQEYLHLHHLNTHFGMQEKR